VVLTARRRRQEITPPVGSLASFNITDTSSSYGSFVGSFPKSQASSIIPSSPRGGGGNNENGEMAGVCTDRAESSYSLIFGDQAGPHRVADVAMPADKSMPNGGRLIHRGRPRGPSAPTLPTTTDIDATHPLDTPVAVAVSQRSGSAIPTPRSAWTNNTAELISHASGARLASTSAPPPPPVAAPFASHDGLEPAVIDERAKQRARIAAKDRREREEKERLISEAIAREERRQVRRDKAAQEARDAETKLKKEADDAARIEASRYVPPLPIHQMVQESVSPHPKQEARRAEAEAAEKQQQKKKSLDKGKSKGSKESKGNKDGTEKKRSVKERPSKQPLSADVGHVPPFASPAATPQRQQTSTTLRPSSASSSSKVDSRVWGRAPSSQGNRPLTARSIVTPVPSTNNVSSSSSIPTTMPSTSSNVGIASVRASPSRMVSLGSRDGVASPSGGVGIASVPRPNSSIRRAAAAPNPLADDDYNTDDEHDIPSAASSRGSVASIQRPPTHASYGVDGRSLVPHSQNGRSYDQHNESVDDGYNDVNDSYIHEHDHGHGHVDDDDINYTYQPRARTASSVPSRSYNHNDYDDDQYEVQHGDYDDHDY
jgi:hypothetical protein